MSRGRPLFSFRRGESSEGWIGTADLMAGLMMVFLLLAIWRSEVSDPQKPCPPIICDEPVDEVLVALQEAEDKIREALNKEFESDFKKWNATILEESITIRFLDNIFFEQGESQLKPEAREILENFFPRYMRVLHDGFADVIREVRIEGHTSSEWGLDDTTEQNSEQFAFIKNMELSQARTRATMEYVLTLPDTAPYEKWIRKKVTANGLSSARLLNSNGKELQEGEAEDKKLSRRVEFAVRVDILQAYEDYRTKREKEKSNQKEDEEK